jgi:hypothetical protein
MRYKLPFDILSQTFKHFRQCGDGQRECQALWISAWQGPEIITDVIHSTHTSHVGGYAVDTLWLSHLWCHLADREKGIRVQVHTHPQDAFHSPSDDAFPIVHSPGFLSLVIPNFAMGSVSFEGAYLAQIEQDGSWREVRCEDHIEIT